MVATVVTKSLRGSVSSRGEEEDEDEGVVEKVLHDVSSILCGGNEGRERSPWGSLGEIFGETPSDSRRGSLGGIFGGSPNASPRGSIGGIFGADDAKGSPRGSLGSGLFS